MARSKTQYTETLYVYVKPAQYKHVRKAAEKSGQSLSEYVDNLIAKDQAGKKSKHVGTARRAA